MNSKAVLSILATLFAVVLVVFAPRLAGSGDGANTAVPAATKRVDSGDAQQANSPAAPVSRSSGAAPGSISRESAGFASRRALDEHFEKHGGEFGGASREQYLFLARALRDAPAGGAIREAVRDDGVITRFDTSSGAFIAFDADRTIRTFFKPNDGLRYFERQIDKAH